MRADRLLSIVLLLQAHHRLTSRSLAERLEVSQRTIHRDMDALSGAGIPVVADRGAAGGWFLLSDYKTTLTGLNETEVQSLFLTKPTKVLTDLNLERAAEGALLKLLASVPASYRNSVERARNRIYVDVTGWARREEAVPLLPVLQESIWLERQLSITYQRGPGCEPVIRQLSPLGLVAKGSAWYLVAAIENDLRSYRVSRISHAKVLDQAAQFPEEFDLAQFWEQTTRKFKSQLPNYVAKFKVAPDVVPRLSFAGRFARVGKAGATDEHGWIEVEVGFDIEEMACEYALSFGAQLEVISPPALREKVVDAAREVLKFYKVR
jgi:predicted DNA-binding transcriptional regulator YafY